MKKRWERKGYFFLLDSILALSVLIVGGVMVYSMYIGIPAQQQSAILSEDLMDFLVNNQIQDVNNQYAGVGGTLWSQGLIRNPEHSLLEQTAEFYANGNLPIAEKFIENLTSNVIPSQYEFELYVNEVLLYPQSPSVQHMQSKSSTRTLIPSKKIVHGFLNEETGDIFGPYATEVILWQKTG